MSADMSEGKQQVMIPGWKVLMFQLFTVLSYANSAVNPLLYVFVNDNFRQNCLAAVRVSSRSSQHLVAMTAPSGRPRSALVARRTVAVATASGAEIELQPIR